MTYKFVRVDSDDLISEIDNMIGVACSLNSQQNYENLMSMRENFKEKVQEIYKVEKKIE